MGLWARLNVWVTKRHEQHRAREQERVDHALSLLTPETQHVLKQNVGQQLPDLKLSVILFPHEVKVNLSRAELIDYKIYYFGDVPVSKIKVTPTLIEVIAACYLWGQPSPFDEYMQAIRRGQNIDNRDGLM